MKVQIDSSGIAEHQAAISVLNACSEAGVNKVTLGLALRKLKVGYVSGGYQISSYPNAGRRLDKTVAFYESFGLEVSAAMNRPGFETVFLSVEQ